MVSGDGVDQSSGKGLRETKGGENDKRYSSANSRVILLCSSRPLHRVLLAELEGCAVPIWTAAIVCMSQLGFVANDIVAT